MRFSIIIPVQKSDWFRLSLASLLNQSFPKTDYEIIIVDDSGGNVRSLISQLQIQLKGFLWSYCLCGHGSGRSAARNKGLQQATSSAVSRLLWSVSLITHLASGFRAGLSQSHSIAAS